ncbi:MAG: extracellular solute-binding protein, partial [Spirochaetaceae bacterium]|nr:extracellular solute-binding protein [Spirochaetaceae bacterium]
MRRRIFAAAALSCMLAGAAPLAPALDIDFPSQSVRRLGQAELEARADLLVLEDGSRARGFALGEVVPLASEVWKLEARGRAASRVWADEALGEKLFSLYLVEGEPLSGKSGARPQVAAADASGWDLVVGTERFRGVESILVEGEALSEDGLEVWLAWEGVAELKAEIARFASEHGKKIKAVEVPNTQSKLLAVARAGGTLPDLVMIQSDYVPALAGGGLLQSVDYFRDPRLEAKGYDAFASGGKSWASPLYFDAQLVFYNRSLSGGDPPADWSLEDLVRRARAVKGRVKAPLSWNVYSAYWLVPFMSGFGKARLVEADGRVIVDDVP